MRPLEPSELVDLVNGRGTTPVRTGARAVAGGRPDLARSDAEAVEVADRVHAVFRDPGRRVELVNAMLADSGVRPVLGPDGASWQARHELLAAAALALRAADPDRTGVCADSQCADVYVDGSPAGHRRFCSVTCQNRTRVAAFRERRRAARDQAGPLGGAVQAG